MKSLQVLEIEISQVGVTLFGYAASYLLRPTNRSQSPAYTHSGHDNLKFIPEEYHHLIQV